MNSKLSSLILISTLLTYWSSAQTTVMGKVTNELTGEGLVGAKISF
ncbi:MAG: hypothetical protein HN542_04095 [Flavobacteriales bacterium]|nr:hypothetical protein [Flavobacteriales bacterium]NCG29312.1 hypothetical protein [Bacteroidota bacterium]MBT3962515.1 hypothetical protein [Flavobacteriales bacterium]MBT4706032.1 hypothetical protein [Flavobacteriales bacterium]MBT4931446.1 hypothetical protein [Flavobacteriales bacterium]